MLVCNETTAQHCTQSTTLFDKLTNTGLVYRHRHRRHGGDCPAAKGMVIQGMENLAPRSFLKVGTYVHRTTT